MASSPPAAEAFSPSPSSEAVLDAITKPILEAIEAVLMMQIDHLESACTLICHDLDKIRGRLTEAEDRFGSVEDQQGSHASQLADLKSLVISLVHKVDD